MDDNPTDSTSRKSRTSSKDIAAALEREIKAGSLAADSLPPRTDLAARFGASRATVRTAIEILIARGVAIELPEQRPRPTRPRRRRRPSSTARRIAETLAAEIRAGKPAPGTPLPASAVARRFDTGTTYGYEVVGLLAELDLVVVQGQGRPALVAGGSVGRALTGKEIAARLAREIADGSYASGTALPASTVAQRFETSEPTARRVIDQLAARGLVIPPEGSRPARIAATPHRS